MVKFLDNVDNVNKGSPVRILTAKVLPVRLNYAMSPWLLGKLRRLAFTATATANLPTQRGMSTSYTWVFLPSMNTQALSIRLTVLLIGMSKIISF